MSEQYRCNKCGFTVEIQDDATGKICRECGQFVGMLDGAVCDKCRVGKMEHLRYTRGVTMVVGENNLKPCPFCGETAEIQVDVSYFWVECTKCGATGEVHLVFGENSNTIGASLAVKSWNTRSTEDALRAELASLREKMCATCGGIGEVYWYWDNPATGTEEEAKSECPDCNGTGIRDLARRDKQTSEHLKWMAEQGNTITGLRNELKECYEMIARMKSAGDDLIQLANYKNKRALEYIDAWSALTKELEKRKWVK